MSTTQKNQKRRARQQSPSPDAKRRATITDVALAAKVNIATVSRVLSRPELVKESTRERIKRIMAELRYSPNLSARALARSRTGAVAVFVSTMDSTYSSRNILSAIEIELEKREQHLLVVVTPDKESLHKKIANVGADAIVMIGWHLEKDDLDVLNDRHLHTVLFQCVLPIGMSKHTPFSEVRLNHRLACELLVNELVRAGSKNLAYLDTGPDLNSQSFMGFLDGLAKNELMHDPRLAMPVGINAPHGVDVYTAGWNAAGVLIKKSGCSFNGAIAGGDINAVGFANSLRKMGLRVPQEVRVAAINDSYYNVFSSPTITSARFDPGQIATTICSQLEADGVEYILLDPEIISRESTAPD